MNAPDYDSFADPDRARIIGQLEELGYDAVAAKPDWRDCMSNEALRDKLGELQYPELGDELGSALAEALAGGAA